jgi:hypothetical protein
VRWSPTANFEMDNNFTVIAEGTNPRDAYSIVVSFTIPEGKYGVNYVQLVRYGADDILSYQFSIKPKLSVEPSTAIVGSSLTIKGTGFPSEEEGTVVMDGLLPGMEFKANDLGSFTVDMTIPETIAGNHKLVANAPRLFADTALTSFDVKPQITLYPENPEVGADVTISGNGFASSSPVSITYDAVQLADKPTTDEKGKFSFTFKVTEGSNDKHEIMATDKAGNTARYGMPLEITPPPKPAILAPKDPQQTFGLIGAEIVAFSWTPVSDPSGVTYIVEVAENLDFFPLKPGMRKTGLSETTWSVEVPPGTYFWRVRAIDGAGNEGEWAVSPHFFKVGIISLWYLIGGGAVILIIFILLVSAFIKRLKDYYG